MWARALGEGESGLIEAPRPAAAQAADSDPGPRAFFADSHTALPPVCTQDTVPRGGPSASGLGHSSPFPRKQALPSQRRRSGPAVSTPRGPATHPHADAWCHYWIFS